MNIPMRYEPYDGAIFSPVNNEESTKSIFVSIVSHKDPYVINTISSLIQNAKKPENIFVSVVVSERQPGSVEWISALMDLQKDNMNNVTLSIEEESNKTTYGKLKKIADSKYNKETFYMSVSPRSEFDPHWDSLLIKQYESLDSYLPEDIIFTSEPRKFLYHDEVVKGFVYFTNHKTKISMQREEYDGARIPISGYSEFINEKNIEYDLSHENDSISVFESLIEKNNAKVDEEFLSNFGFPKFSSRKFTKDEYIALSSGVSYKFIFCDAKKYIKLNNSLATLVDENQYNFYSFVNLIKNNFKVLSMRFTPVYQLHDDRSGAVAAEKSISSLYSDEEYKNSQGIEDINRIKQNFVYKDDYINVLLSIDWVEKKFKSRKFLLNDPLTNLINLFISLYNFSTYENSLHWNKKC